MAAGILAKHVFGKPWLICLAPQLGDAVVTTVSIEQARRFLAGRAELVLATTPELQPLFAARAGVERVFAYRCNGASEVPGPSCDVVIDLGSTAASAHFCASIPAAHHFRQILADAGTLVSWGHRTYPLDAFTSGQMGNTGTLPEPAWVVEAQVIAFITGGDVQRWVSEGCEPRLASVRSVGNSACHPVVVLAPCGGLPAKRWPDANWIALSLALVDAGCIVQVVLGPQEVTNSTLRGFPGSVGLIRPDTTGTLGNILDRADLIIANDCGPMHVAAALGRPTLAIFGPTNPRVWFCYSGQSREYIQVAGEHTQPGTTGNCPQWPAVGQVLERARQLLHGFHASR